MSKEQQHNAPKPPLSKHTWIWCTSLLLLWFASCPSPNQAGEERLSVKDSGTNVEVTSEQKQEAGGPERTKEEPTNREPTSEIHVTPELLTKEEPAPEPSAEKTNGTQEQLPEQLPEALPEPTKDQKPPEITPDTHPYFTCTPASATDTYKVRQWVFGKKNYIQYIPGNAPLILLAPHGGDLQARQDFPNVIWPIVDAKGDIVKDNNGDPIPSRDGNSLEKTLEVAHIFYKLTGLTPHIIINRVVRGRLQLNSDLALATRGKLLPNMTYAHPRNTLAEGAWNEFHQFIKAAKTWVQTHCQRGLILDMHTNGRSDKQNGMPYSRSEFGYILGISALSKPLPTLEAMATSSSIRALAALPWNRSYFVEMLRGKTSLGDMLQQGGYDTIPSTKYTNSTDKKYFTGGYNIREHGSQTAGVIDAIQLESNFSFINNATARASYTKRLANAVISFMERYYRFPFKGKGTAPIHGNCNTPKAITFVTGKAQITDTTWGASNEFGDNITCGQNDVQVEGPQLYYKLRLQKGKQYTFTVTADHYARLYLFQSACNAALISESCLATGVNGKPFASHNTPMTKRYRATSTGDYILAVDSRKASWFGTFRLDIQETP